MKFLKFLESDRTAMAAVLLLLIAAGLLGIILIVDFLAIGPGHPPPSSLQKWYVPQPRAEYAENGSVVANRTMDENLVLLDGIEEGSPPLFPVLSRYSSHATYADTRSGDRYLVVSWYFDDAADFSQAEEVLCRHLRAFGNVSPVDLALPAEPGSSRGETVSGSISATKFESESSSGYFLVVEKPLSPEYDDYFLVYFGVFGPSSLCDHTAALEYLMLRSSRLDGARPLAPCS